MAGSAAGPCPSGGGGSSARRPANGRATESGRPAVPPLRAGARGARRAFLPGGGTGGCRKDVKGEEGEGEGT